MRTSFVGVMLLACPLPLAAATPSPNSKWPPVKRWEVRGHLEGEVKDGKVLGNVSGLACTGSAVGVRQCLVIDDELTSAQRVTIANRTMTSGSSVELVGAGQAIGAAPALNCDERKKPKDLDGEAVAESGGTFYVIGSHGCGRSGGAFRPSSFLIVRLSPAGRVDLSYRVSEGIQALPQVRDFFGKRLQEIAAKPADDEGPATPARPDENGLNVEGMAVSNQRLWVGLRGPVVNCTAYVVSMDADAVFDAEGRLDSRAHALALDPDHGVRDLARLADGRMLVLSGPRTNAGAGYSIWVFDPRSAAAPTKVHTFGPNEVSGKPEGLLVLAETPAGASVLVVQDGPVDGDPREIAIRIPPRAATPAGKKGPGTASPAACPAASRS